MTQPTRDFPPHMIPLGASICLVPELSEGLLHLSAEVDLSWNILEKLGMLFETVLKAGESSFLPRFATLHVPGQLPALIQ